MRELALPVDVLLGEMVEVGIVEAVLVNFFFYWYANTLI